MIELSQVARSEASPIWADAPVLLRAEGLRKAFGGQVVLDGVSVELKRGEVVLLRGENGSGKTTLLNILTGNLEPDAGAIHYLADGTPRTYRFPRHWWQELSPFDHFVPEFVAREGIGRTWQDVRLFSSQTLRDNISVAEPGHPGENPLLALIATKKSALMEKTLRDRADTVLSRFGLAGREGSSADKISLGQSKRVAIARAVSAGARILFLDEPLAGLDRQGIADVLGLLESLVRERTITLVIVEHVLNQPRLQGLVTTDWHLANGKLPVTHHSMSGIQQSMPSLPPPWLHLLAGDNAELLDEPLPQGAVLTRIRRPDRFRSPPKPVLEIRHLIVKRGPRTVIGLDDDGSANGLTLTLNENEIAVLQAPNGWGKSTLIAAICGQVPHASGEIFLRGKSFSNKSTWERIALGLTVLPSGGHSFPNLRCNEVETLAGISNRNWLASQELPNHRCSEFSGGQLQRLALTIAQARPDDVLRVLDEPFSMLDLASTLQAATSLIERWSPCVLLSVPLYVND